MSFRYRNFLISIIFPILYILFLKVARLEGFVLISVVIIGFLLEYFLSFWLFKFNVLPQGFLTILLLPAIWFGSFLLISQFFLFGLKNQFEILAYLFLLTFQYYFLSTQNILNLSYFKNLTLSQAAFTANNFYTIVTFFFSTLAVFLIPNLYLFARLIVVFILFIVILFTYIYLHRIDKSQFYYSVFLFGTLLVLIFGLNLLGILGPQKLILISLILSLLFRGIVVFLLFSTRKVLTLIDYLHIVFEAVILSFIIWFVSIFRS